MKRKVLVMLNKSKKDNKLWHTGRVKRGTGDGGKISYPTVNLEATLLSENLPRGVYASWVKVGTDKYMGALYYGPRKVKGESFDVLEIHLLDFNQDIYGKKIKFTLDQFIRGVKNFNSLENLKKRISNDIKQVIISLEEK